MEWDFACRLFSDAAMAGIGSQLSSLLDRLNDRSDQKLQAELRELGDLPG